MSLHPYAYKLTCNADVNEISMKALGFRGILEYHIDKILLI